MLKTKIISLIIIYQHSLLGNQPKIIDNYKLKRIYKLDQSSRNNTNMDPDTLSKLDSQNKYIVIQMLIMGKIRTAMDYYRAAMILQHGNNTDDYKLAFSLSKIAATLKPNDKHILWLTAATWDRILMSKNVPQWYGTQYYQETPNSPIFLYRIDENIITDKERLSLNLPTLHEAKELEKEFQNIKKQ